MCNKLNDYSDWLADEHVRATGAVEYFDQPGLGKVPYPAVPGGMTRPATWAPTQGAGGAAALAAFGVSESEMADLVASGAITLTGS